MQVYEQVDANFMKEKGLKAIGTRWVIVHKGVAKNPLIRARLVSQETKRTTTLDPDDSSVAEALRLMMSLAMSGQPKRATEQTVLAFFEMSRAHFSHFSSEVAGRQNAEGGQGSPRDTQSSKERCTGPKITVHVLTPSVKQSCGSSISMWVCSRRDGVPSW